MTINAGRSRPSPLTESADKDVHAARDRLAADLAAAQAKLNRRRKAVPATEGAIAELSRKLKNAGGLTHPSAPPAPAVTAPPI